MSEDAQLEAIDAEMSATSEDEEPLTTLGEVEDNDAFSVLRRKVKQRFVSKKAFEQQRAELEGVHKKYLKYKQKYQSFVSEVQVQMLVQQYQNVDQLADQVDQLMKDSDLSDRARLDLASVRQTLDQKLDKLNQEIHYQLQFVNTKEEKIEEQLKRISQKFCFSEYEAQCLLHASLSADERGKKLLSRIQDTFN